MDGSPPHYFLRSVGVDPGAQGRGVGAGLIEPVLDQARGEGVGCFLWTAAAENVSWYERLGFSVVDSRRPTPTWPRVWAMWSEP